MSIRESSSSRPNWNVNRTLWELENPFWFLRGRRKHWFSLLACVRPSTCRISWGRLPIFNVILTSVLSHALLCRLQMCERSLIIPGALFPPYDSESVSCQIEVHIVWRNENTWCLVSHDLSAFWFILWRYFYINSLDYRVYLILSAPRFES